MIITHAKRHKKIHIFLFTLQKGITDLCPLFLSFFQPYGKAFSHNLEKLFSFNLKETFKKKTLKNKS